MSRNSPDADPCARPSPSGWTVAGRITVWYAFSALVLLLVLAAVLDRLLLSTLESEIARVAERENVELAGILRDTPGDAGELREEILRGSGTSAGVRVWMRVRDASGRSVAESDDMTASGLFRELFPSPTILGTETRDGQLARLRSGGPVRTFAFLAPAYRAGEEGATIEIAVDGASTMRILSRFRRHLAEVVGIGYIVLLLVGYVVARRGLQPIRSIVGTMRRIGSTTLHERVPAAHLSGEPRALAFAFNEVLDRLDSSFLRLAQFSADIAHELRTPLSRMRLAAEMALRERSGETVAADALADCLEESVKLSHLIDRLLFLARAEGPESLPRRDRIHLRSTLESLAEFYRPSAEEARVSLSVEVDEGISANVDRQLFLQAVGNLVQNAIAYTPAGGSVQLSGTGESSDVCVVVSDTGCGIPASNLPQLFDAFHRVDRARSTNSGGSGLGLAIVRKIARLHGGEVGVSSEFGKGTEVRMRLPCRA